MTAAVIFNKLISLTWLWLMVAGLCGFVILTAWWCSPRMKGWRGERWVRLYLGRLDPAVYHCLHDLLIKNGEGGWAQIDHVVVSPFGIFVIETKNYGGWIAGSETDRDWTVCYKGGRKDYPLNPLVQNKRHIRAVERLLELPPGRCHNIVFLAGDAVLKKGPLPGVVTGRLARHIESFQTPLLEAWECAALAGSLRNSSYSHDPESRKAHRRQVQAAADRARGGGSG